MTFSMDLKNKNGASVSGMSSTASEMTIEQKKELARSLLIRKAESVRKVFPMSVGQEALWFLYLNQPDSTAYNEGFAVRLLDKTDEVALKRAFQRLADRHEALRSRFAFRDGLPVQEVLGYQSVDFAVADALALDPAELNSAVKSAFDRPHRLEDGQVFRARLFRRKDDESILVVSIHHIVCDGWSVNLLLGELLEAYNAEKKEKQPTLAPLLWRYSDFVENRQKWLDGPEGERCRQFWKDVPGLDNHLTDLPLDRPRGAYRSEKGGESVLHLGKSTSERLSRLAKEQHATLFNLLLAVYKVLIFKYSGQKELVIGIPAANRQDPRFESVVGYFVNPLPISSNIDEDRPFTEYLAGLQQIVLTAVEHQDFPFPTLVESLGIHPDPGFDPVFQSFFYLQSQSQYHRLNELLVPGNEGARIKVGELTLGFQELSSKEGRFDLSMEWIETDERLSLISRYNAALFDESTIRRMLEHYERLIEAVLSDPERLVKDLESMPDREKELILESFKGPVIPIPDGTFSTIWREQAVKTPERTALQCGNRRVTYAEADRYARRFSACLRREFGLGPEQVAGIMMDRSEYYLLALLSVLGAEAAFLPIDPGLPWERAQKMLSESGAAVLITAGDIEAGADCPCPVFSLTGRSAELEEDPVAEDVERGQPGQLAYIIYTSGSTGKPKGAMIEQAGMMNHLFAKIRDLELNERSVVVQNASISFDISVWQSLAALLTGGCTLILRQDLVMDPHRFAAAIAEGGVTVVEMVPSYLTEILELWPSWPAAPDWSRLQYVLVTGETLSKDLASHWFARFPELTLVNAYGPTEASDDITHFIMDGPPSGASVPVGYPVQNTRIYILDENRNLRPIGGKGEICVAGVGVGRGYFGDPAATGRAFIRDPFSENGDRMYRTGDVGRYLGDGRIEFFGRRDDQVKINGFRIEPGEIEARLQAHPGVTACAVVAAESPGRSSKHLAAYIAVTDPATPESEIRRFLQERLPAYMIPEKIRIMAELPLTANGKVDRKALPQTGDEPAGRMHKKSYAAPATLWEHRLVGIWQEVLQIRRIGVDENFFHIGGNSLKAIRVIARVRAEWGVDLRFRDFFRHPSAGELAGYISTAPAARLTDWAKAPLRPYYPVSPGQRRLLQWNFLHQSSAAYSMPGLFRVKGNLDRIAFESAFQQMVERHEILRTNYFFTGGEFNQFVQPVHTLRFGIEWADLRSDPAPGQTWPMAANEEIRRKFDLENELPLRVKVWQLGDVDWGLLINIHHIAADAWSLRIFVREWLTAYFNRKRDQDSQPESLPLQYKDYAWRLNEMLTAGALDKHKEYWKNQLSGELPKLNLDLPQPKTADQESGTLVLELDPEFVDSLTSWLQDINASLYMGLAASFSASLFKLTGQEDFILGATVAGRQVPELDDLIGFFVHVLPLRVRMDAQITFTRLVEQMRDRMLEAFEHQDYPVEELLDELNMGKTAGFSGLIGAIVELIDREINAAEDFRIPDLEITPLPVEPPGPKFGIAFRFLRRRSGLTLQVEFDANLYAREAVSDFCNRWKTLTEKLIRTPERPLGNQTLLTGDEQRTLMEWGGVYRNPGECPLVADQFEATAAQYPERIALRFESHEMTYQALDRRADFFAERLIREFGVKPGDLVGILADRSLLLVPAILGIIKSGAAFLPLDPAYPSERLNYIIKDAGLSVVVTDSIRIFDLSSQNPELEVAWLDEFPDGNGPVQKPGLRPGASDAAYLIYTSGSTGQPKGVEVMQSNFAHYLTWANQYYFNAGSGWPMPLFTSLSFDLTVTSIFSTLLRGDMVHVFPEKMPVHAILKAIFDPESGMRAVKLTPSHILLLRHLEMTSSGIQKLIAGGEPLTEAHLRTLYALNPAMEVYNEYGPTETTVGCTVDRLTAPEDEITIGRPIDRTIALVLDPSGNICPPAYAGELYIGGAGVTSGYRGKPELTREKFVASRFDIEGAPVLYRTGDRAEWGLDGRLRYLGRIDEQVKIRGYRVEPGEVEAAVLQTEDIADCAVIAQWVNGAVELIAFVVAGSPDRESEWMKSLARVLPGHMVPGHWVPVDRIPLNNNGKADKSRLLEHWLSRRNEKEKEPERPESDLERSLKRIWSTVLGIADISVHDQFFELGGHSLRAVQMLMLIQEQTGAGLDLNDVFEYPTISSLAARIKQVEVKTGSSIVPVGERTYYETSYAQKRLWLIHQMEEELSAYNIAAACEIAGNADPTAMESAIKALGDRHESLRTVFAAIEGEPMQVIIPADQWPVPFEVIDLYGDPDREETARMLAEAQADQVFDLETGPLLSVRLLLMEETRSILLFTVHHLISDGWSVEILARELFHYYENIAAGKPAELLPLPVQYKDFAHWQNKNFSGRALDQAGKFWKACLAGELPVLQLPTDYPRPKIKTFQSRNVEMHFSAWTAEKIRSLAIEEETTPFTVIFAAVAGLLYRYSGQEDLIIGTPSAGRNHHLLRDQVGLYLNTLPIRCAVGDHISFRELVRAIKSGLLAAYEHQEYPFDRIVDDLQPVRDTSRSALFDVLVVSNDFELPVSDHFTRAAAGELQIRNYPVDRSGNKYDLTFYYRQTDDGFDISLAYNISLFTRERIRLMGDHLSALLTGMVQEPEAAIVRPPLLTVAEYDRWVRDFNDTAIPYPREKMLHNLFEEQAALHPDAVALRHEGRSRSYGELNAEANRLARRLMAAGVRPGDRVGLIADRNMAMITGMIAILKAGAAYVPADPDYPLERQEYILANSEVAMLLTDTPEKASQVHRQLPAVPCLAIQETEAYAHFNAGNPDLGLSSESLAYVIYTSGSTGRPKGVMIAHHAVVNLIQWVNRTFEVGAGDRLLLLTSMCFDLSVYDIFGMLAGGGAVVIAGRDQLTDFRELKRLMVEERITFWDTVPSTLDYLTGELRQYEPDFRQEYLRLAFLSGDWIPVGLPDNARKCFPNASVISLGGATEGTVWSNFFPIGKMQEDWTSIPYGKPIANNCFYILDSGLNPVPQGVTGELYIGGAGVAMGYMNEPQKTAAAFLQDPFFPEPGGMMYRTGDLGRMMADGNMEFLGRRDHQVKIRGFRVELQEIEAVLNAFEGVEKGIVSVWEHPSKGKQLAAYFIPSGDEPADGLRDHLMRFLPDYMQPAAFVMVPAFPLNANGKIDRRSLPPPDSDRRDREPGKRPVTEMERNLEPVFCKLMGLESLDLNENFFQAGGNSLLAAQIAARIQHEMGIPIRLRHLFLYPTLEELSSYLETLVLAEEIRTAETSGSQEEILI